MVVTVVNTITTVIKQKDKLNSRDKEHTEIWTNNECDGYIGNYT